MIPSVTTLTHQHAPQTVPLRDGTLDLSSPGVMGVINVTPDSFSDGGRNLDPGQAIASGLQMAAEGARVLDVGGESTRPGAATVSVEEEIQRVVPVVKGLVAWASSYACLAFR